MASTVGVAGVGTGEGEDMVGTEVGEATVDEADTEVDAAGFLRGTILTTRAKGDHVCLSAWVGQCRSSKKKKEKKKGAPIVVFT